MINLFYKASSIASSKKTFYQRHNSWFLNQFEVN